MPDIQKTTKGVLNDSTSKTDEVKSTSTEPSQIEKLFSQFIKENNQYKDVASQMQGNTQFLKEMFEKLLDFHSNQKN